MAVEIRKTKEVFVYSDGTNKVEVTIYLTMPNDIDDPFDIRSVYTPDPHFRSLVEQKVREYLKQIRS